jgi:hypothetical protein
LAAITLQEMANGRFGKKTRASVLFGLAPTAALGEAIDISVHPKLLV